MDMAIAIVKNMYTRGLNLEQALNQSIYIYHISKPNLKIMEVPILEWSQSFL